MGNSIDQSRIFPQKPFVSILCAEVSDGVLTFLESILRCRGLFLQCEKATIVETKGIAVVLFRVLVSISKAIDMLGRRRIEVGARHYWHSHFAHNTVHYFGLFTYREI